MRSTTAPVRATVSTASSCRPGQSHDSSLGGASSVDPRAGGMRGALLFFLVSAAVPRATADWCDVVTAAGNADWPQGFPHENHPTADPPHCFIYTKTRGSCDEICASLSLQYVVPDWAPGFMACRTMMSNLQPTFDRASSGGGGSWSGTACMLSYVMLLICSRCRGVLPAPSEPPTGPPLARPGTKRCRPN